MDRYTKHFYVFCSFIATEFRSNLHLYGNKTIWTMEKTNHFILFFSDSNFRPIAPMAIRNKHLNFISDSHLFAIQI
jgi:hypothetical protein